MKKHLLSFASGFILMIIGITGIAQVPMLPQTVTMGPGYANEGYYQFTTYNATMVARDLWDLSFRTAPSSASILINDGSTSILWSYPYADTSGWATLDTFTLYTWHQLYNDPDDWENGAFNRNATGDPNYGWGVYNPSTNIITGDSIFVLQLKDATFKKVWIVEKNLTTNTYLIRYANLDGSDFQEVTVDCSPYEDKDQVGLNMQGNFTVDYQPVKTSWDILFTKYVAWHPTGAPVIVTGVLSNPASTAKKFYPVDPDYNDWQVGPWDPGRSTIGWDWKYFDFGSFTYFIEDSMIFYVNDQLTNVYRLVFTGFEGTSTGVIDFGIARVLTAGIDNNNASSFNISLYPNPAIDLINIEIDAMIPADAITVSLRDLAGRIVRTEVLPSGQKQARWNIAPLSPGAYLLEVSSGKEVAVKKIFKL